MAKRVHGGKSEYAKHLRPAGKAAAAKSERAHAAYTIRVEGGHVAFVYDDGLADLLDEGDATVTRVSHVEPHAGGGWAADMAPVDGPVILGADGKGFATRAAALAAERDWLTVHRGL
jgi:hypothetical protein